MKKDRKRSWGLKTIFSVIMQNWSALLSFELIYKIAGLTFFFPFLRNLISFLPGLIHENYLSQENIVHIFPYIVQSGGSFIISVYSFAPGRIFVFRGRRVDNIL